jgi:hypothetical protein
MVMTLVHLLVETEVMEMVMVMANLMAQSVYSHFQAVFGGT